MFLQIFCVVYRETATLGVAIGGAVSILYIVYIDCGNLGPDAKFSEDL